MSILELKSGHDTRNRSSSPVKVKWDYETCTGGMESAFARLTRAIRKKPPCRLELDMSKCTYLSITGLRCVLDWYLEMAHLGYEVRIRGLGPLQSRIIQLAKLTWLLCDK